MNHVTLPLHNLGFQGAHAARAERVLAQLPGVVRAYVSADTEMAYIEYEAEETGTTSIQEALIASGFGAPPLTPVMSPLAARGGASPVRRPARGVIVLGGALWLLFSGSLLVLTGGAAGWSILLVAGGGALGVWLLARAWHMTSSEQRSSTIDQPPTASVRGHYTRRDR